METTTSVVPKAKLSGTLTLLKDSWQIYRQKIWLIVLLYLAIGLVSGVIGGLAILVMFFLHNTILLIILGIIGLVVILGLIVISVIAQAAIHQIIKDDTRKYSFKEAWQVGYEKGVGFFSVTIWNSIMVMLWSLLLLIPGLIMGIKYSLAIWVFFYEGFNGRSALKRSKELVKGYWWPIFGRFFLISAILGVIIYSPLIFISKDSPWLSVYSVVINVIIYLLTPLFLVFSRNIYLSLIQIKGTATTIENKSSKGWLVALIVIFLIVIIGIWATFATVALGNARMKARDASRASDIRQIQTALELYYNDNSEYPASIDQGLGNYLSLLPVNPSPATGSVCPSNSAYQYKLADDKQHYTLDFCLEADMNDKNLKAGPNEVTEADYSIAN